MLKVSDMEVSDYIQEREALLSLQHVPRWVNQDSLPQAFSEAWESFANNEPAHYSGEIQKGFESVVVAYTAYHPFTQDDAHILAQVMRWLGTHGGQSFLDDVAELCKSGLPTNKVFLFQWSYVNSRLPCFKSERLIDLIMCEPKVHAAHGETFLPADVLSYSVEVQELLECLMLWLGSHEGLTLLNVCQPERHWLDLCGG